MSKLNIAPNLKLPRDVVTTAAAALGIRGSGKTNTGVVIVEELLTAGEQVIVIDPLDVWWGLKGTADDRGAGHPITVIGGAHGDVPLAEGDGRTLADFLVDHPVPAVLSLRHLTKSASRRFMTEFAEHFYHRKGGAGKNTPVLMVVDEASIFIPQHVTGDIARLVGAIQSWVRQGRVAGIGCLLIDQRPATVNKDVLSQVELLICHRLVAPQDRKALREWIDAHATAEQQAAFDKTVATLERGEAWFWSPEWLDVFERVKVRARSTFDSSATPKAGKAITAPKKLAAVDLDQLRTKLQTTIERARADDPKALRARIAELEKALATQQPKVERVEVPIIKPEQWGLLDDTAEGIRMLLNHLQVTGAQWADMLAMFRRIDGRPQVARTSLPIPTAKNVQGQLGQTPANYGSLPPIGRDSQTPRQSSPRAGGESHGLKKPQLRILDAIAWWNSIDVDAPTRAQVGFVAGIKPTGGHFSNSIGPLSTRGLIETTGDGVRLTTAGRELANAPERAPTLAAYHAMIRELLKTGAMKSIFDAIVKCVEHADGWVSVNRIGELTGINPAGGHFSNSIGPLGTLGLITRRDGKVEPTKLLFPAGLR